MANQIPQEQQWQEWAAAAQAGDKRAYNQLLSALVPYIANVVRPSVSSPDAVDDIVQDVLISIHKSLKTYSPDRPFKPWLLAITNFRRTDYLRKYYASRKNKQVNLDNLDFQQQNVTNPAHAGELKDIEEALATLPEQQRRIFEMVKIQGFTASEVANEMGMKESAVKVSAHRAAKKLKGYLQ